MSALNRVVSLENRPFTGSRPNPREGAKPGRSPDPDVGWREFAQKAAEGQLPELQSQDAHSDLGQKHQKAHWGLLGQVL